MDASLSLLPLLSLGFLMGLRHALEADHLAAVASLAARSPGERWGALRVAAAWGTGHAAVLLLAALASGLSGAVLPPRLQAGSELLVGAVVVWLGLDVLLRARQRGVHLHAHAHADGTRHLHAHRHPPSAARASHEHVHAPGSLRRSLLVGALHGLSGSAVIGLLATQGMALGTCLAYAALFGIGSIAGMLALSAIVALPLGGPGGLAGRRFHAAVGTAAIGVGCWLVWGAGSAFLAAL
jgi:hypothetical protein